MTRWSRRFKSAPGIVAAVVAVGLMASGCSSRPIHVSIAQGWKPVSYAGLTIDVPGSWPVYQRSQEPCGISGPGVLVGQPPSRFRPPACPVEFVRAPVLTFGGPDIVVPVGAERRWTINGLEVVVSKLGLLPGFGNGATSEEVVRFPGRNVWLGASVPGMRSAGVLGVVDQVVRTVRVTE